MANSVIDIGHRATLERFRDSLSKGHAVALVGAGVSMPAPSSRPSWPQLLERMADLAEQYSTHIAGLMRELTSEGKLLEAADVFAAGDKVPKVIRARFFHETFATKQDQVTALCRDLASLDVRAWVTTNYDNNLKYALAGREVEVYGNTKTELQSALSFFTERQMLVHLHGQAHLYDTLAYSKATYSINTQTGVYKQFLRRLFSSQAILAIGFSFSDPPFQDVLRYVSEELGGHPTHPHLAILPSVSAADKTTLARAGFELLLYDVTTGHDYVHQCVRELRRGKAAPASRSTRIGDPSGWTGESSGKYAALVSAFLSITNPDRGSTYDTAAAAIVLNELSTLTLDKGDLAERIARRLAVSKSVAESLVARGLEYLREGGRVQLEGRVVRAAAPVLEPASSVQLIDAICTRMITLDKTISRTEEIERAIRDAVTYVMMAQGMAAARAFLNVDTPDWYAVARVVDAAVETASIKRHWKTCLASALKEVLHEPAPVLSRDLFRLANAAFALENVFLNPHGVDLGQALRWKMYLDSNVILRILDESGLSGSGFREFMDRLRRLRAPAYVLGPFVEEIVGNVRLVARQLSAVAATTPDLVERFCEDVPAVERSPVLNWYLWGLRSFRWATFEQFVSREHLEDEASIAKRLQKIGIVVEAPDAISRYDTSERETLWSELREWRAQDADSARGRRLRRAEATQVLYLCDLRADGEKAWFISIDAQLRRALKHVRGGKYAGYVITPGGWLLRLNTLHWGEVDVSGFSELMWAVPRQTPMDRIRAMVMTRVLQAEPDLNGESPDWLRGKVESEFIKFESVVSAAVNAEAEEEAVVADLAEQLVAPSAHRILDELVKRREQRKRR